VTKLTHRLDWNFRKLNENRKAKAKKRRRRTRAGTKDKTDACAPEMLTCGFTAIAKFHKVKAF